MQNGDGVRTAVSSVSQAARLLRDQAGARTSGPHPDEHKNYFDRCIRDDEHLMKTVCYVVNNPAKAGLCAYGEDWLWSGNRVWSDGGGS